MLLYIQIVCIPICILNKKIPMCFIIKIYSSFDSAGTDTVKTSIYSVFRNNGESNIIVVAVIKVLNAIHN